MMLYKLLSGMDRERFSPSVISLQDKGTIGSLIEQLGVPVHALEMRRGIPTPRVVLSLFYLLRRLDPHVIQGWMYHGNLAASLGALACRRPICWNIRQSLYSLTYEKRATALVIRIGALLSGMTSCIVYNAHESLRHHEGVGYHGRSVVIPNGFDTERFRPDADPSVRAELGIPAGSPLIGLVARYHPMKDHENFLRAAALLYNQNPHVHFLLAGKGVDGDNTDLSAMIRNLNLCGHVHLLGERTDVPRITAALDMATLSSYAEAFPNVVGEAMVSGVPCVVTDVGDSAWIVGGTGRVVPPRDSGALADAWLDLIEMGNEGRRELGRRARQRICENFSLDEVVRQYENLYEQLAAKKG